MHAHQLAIFCKVVDCGSFSRAAAELFISQPAVSQHVKGLERQLGAKLLMRRAGELVLSEAGQVVYAKAQEILHAHSEVRRLLDALKAGTRGRVLVGSSPGMLHYLPPMLRRFQAAHPGIDVVFTAEHSDSVLLSVRDGRIDAGIIWGPITSTGVMAHPLHQAPFALVASPDHPLAARPMISARDLSAHGFVMLDHDRPTRQFVEACLAHMGVTARVASVGTTTENVKKMVEANLGITILARRTVHLEVAANSLKVLALDAPPFFREITLILREHRQLPPAVERFTSFTLTESGLFQEQDDTFTA